MPCRTTLYHLGLMHTLFSLHSGLMGISYGMPHNPVPPWFNAHPVFLTFRPDGHLVCHAAQPSSTTRPWSGNGHQGRHSVRSVRHPVRSDRQPVRSDKRPVRSGRHLVRSDRHPVRSDRHPVRSDKHPVRNDRHPVRSDRHSDRKSVV